MATAPDELPPLLRLNDPPADAPIIREVQVEQKKITVHMDDLEVRKAMGDWSELLRGILAGGSVVPFVAS